MAAPVRFLFDFVSPYAYLAWTQLPALARRVGREVEPVPVLFAGMLQALGTRGPAEVAPKRAYLYRHTLRIARALGVPLLPPPAHPFNPLLALRVTAALPPAERAPLVDLLFRGAWAGGGGVEGAARVEALLREGGFDAAGLLAAAEAPAAKAQVRESTEAALAAGAFGVPTFLADGELFFGVDSLGHLEAFLRGEDPLRSEELSAWSALSPSVVRRGSAPG